MTSTEKSTVAIYGGSFDPPHVGHVLVAAYVTSAYFIDHCLVVPAFRHPLEKLPAATFEHRVAMCRLAFAGLPRVEVSDVEATLDGHGYTLELLEALRAREPGWALRLVLGEDLLAETHRWHRWERVAELAPPLVVARQGSSRGAEGPAMPDVRSTTIREWLRTGRSVEGWVPREVVRYIEEHDLYAPSAPTPDAAE